MDKKAITFRPHYPVPLFIFLLVITMSMAVCMIERYPQYLIYVPGIVVLICVFATVGYIVMVGPEYSG